MQSKQNVAYPARYLTLKVKKQTLVLISLHKVHHFWEGIVPQSHQSLLQDFQRYYSLCSFLYLRHYFHHPLGHLQRKLTFLFPSLRTILLRRMSGIQQCRSLVGLTVAFGVLVWNYRKRKPLRQHSVWIWIEQRLEQILLGISSLVLNRFGCCSTSLRNLRKEERKCLDTNLHYV